MGMVPPSILPWKRRVLPKDEHPMQEEWDVIMQRAIAQGANVLPDGTLTFPPRGGSAITRPSHPALDITYVKHRPPAYQAKALYDAYAAQMVARAQESAQDKKILSDYMKWLEEKFQHDDPPEWALILYSSLASAARGERHGRNHATLQLMKRLEEQIEAREQDCCVRGPRANPELISEYWQ